MGTVATGPSQSPQGGDAPYSSSAIAHAGEFAKPTTDRMDLLNGAMDAADLLERGDLAMNIRRLYADVTREVAKISDASETQLSLEEKRQLFDDLLAGKYMEKGDDLYMQVRRIVW